MKTSHLLKTALLAVSLAAASAWAGAKAGFAVQIDTTNRTARGTLGAVRNTLDSVQSIGCQVRAAAGGTPYVFCYAKDSAGTYVSCGSNDAGLVTAASSITPSSHVEFTWNTSGNCVVVDVYTSSLFEPPAP